MKIVELHNATLLRCYCGKPVLSPFRHCQECLQEIEAELIQKRGGLTMASFKHVS